MRQLLTLLFFALSSGIYSQAQSPQDSLYQAGLAAYQAQNYLHALELAKEVNSHKTKLPAAYLLEALAEHKLDNPLGAVEALDRAIRLNPNYLEAIYNRGVLKMGLGELEAALQDFDKVLELKPGIPPVLLARGQLYYQLLRYAEAQKDLQQYLLYQSQNGEALYYLALSLKAQNQQQQALVHLNKCLQLNSENENALSARAEIYAENEDFGKLEADAEKLLRFNPYNLKAYFWRAQALFARNEAAKALEDLQKITEEQSQNAQAWLLTGRCLLALDEKVKACEAWEKAQKLGNETAKMLIEANCP